MIAWPPMRFHNGFGASATCRILTAPAPRPATQLVTPLSEPRTSTTSALVASSTYQPVTVLGRLAAAVLSEETAVASQAYALTSSTSVRAAKPVAPAETSS